MRDRLNWEMMLIAYSVSIVLLYTGQTYFAAVFFGVFVVFWRMEFRGKK